MRGVDMVRRILDQWEENQRDVRRALERHIDDLKQSTEWVKVAFEGFDNSPVEDTEAIVMVAMEWRERQKILDKILGQLEESRRKRQEQLYEVLGERVEEWEKTSQE